MTKRISPLPTPGDFGSAQALLREAHSGFLQTLGRRHPRTLMAVSNMAQLAWSEGRHEEAEALYSEAVSGRAETLGPRHPDTLAAIACLAALRNDQGAQARKVAQPSALCASRLTSCRSCVLCHLVRLLSPFWPPPPLWVLPLGAGQADKAEELCSMALSGLREVFGEGHPQTEHVASLLDAIRNSMMGFA